MAMIVHFSKWQEAAPLPDKVRQISFSPSFVVMGSLRVLLVQGRELVNEVSQTLFEHKNVKHRISSAYHRQTNGLDEQDSSEGSFEALFRMTGIFILTALSMHVTL